MNTDSATRRVGRDEIATGTTFWKQRDSVGPDIELTLTGTDIEVACCAARKRSTREAQCTASVSVVVVAVTPLWVFNDPILI